MILYYDNVEEGRDLFIGLLSELERFPQKNVLKEIDLRIDLDEDHRWIITEDAWLRLATTFKKESFPCLEHVDVSILPWEYDLTEALATKGPLKDLSRLPFKDLGLHFSFSLCVTQDFGFFH